MKKNKVVKLPQEQLKIRESIREEVKKIENTQKKSMLSLMPYIQRKNER